MKHYKLIRPILFLLKAENAHNLSIFALKNNLIAKNPVQNYESLKNNVLNINFNNPVGLAAGYDKNCETLNNLNNFGFGFIECGTVTPRPQSGNPKPRLFRLKEDEAVINRMGFNNKGLTNFLGNVKNKKNKEQVLGINIGKNKDTQDEAIDYLSCLEELYEFATYITINISSPNTKNLRDIQSEDKLSDFLGKISDKKMALQKKFKKNIPLLLKIAPDLNLQEIKQIAKNIQKNKIDGVIISNTTIGQRDNLQNIHKNEIGGLSGKPLFTKSNLVLKTFYQETKGTIPIIGVGGISSGKDAYEKIKLGASLIQLYSAFVYEGFYLVEKIKKELDDLLRADGFSNISEAIGIDNK